MQFISFSLHGGPRLVSYSVLCLTLYSVKASKTTSCQLCDLTQGDVDGINDRMVSCPSGIARGFFFFSSPHSTRPEASRSCAVQIYELDCRGHYPKTEVTHYQMLIPISLIFSGDIDVVRSRSATLLAVICPNLEMACRGLR